MNAKKFQIKYPANQKRAQLKNKKSMLTSEFLENQLPEKLLALAF